jgi:tagatose-1,6-bisphosphate aldolase
MGASAIKLPVYYHPDAPTARRIEELVRQMADDCCDQDISFFLEPLSYSLDSAHKPLLAQERRRVVIETARRLTPLGGDVLKAEFPIDVDSENDRMAFLRLTARPRMERLTALCAALARPWMDAYAAPQLSADWYQHYG